MSVKEIDDNFEDYCSAIDSFIKALQVIREQTHIDLIEINAVIAKIEESGGSQDEL